MINATKRVKGGYSLARNGNKVSKINQVTTTYHVMFWCQDTFQVLSFDLVFFLPVEKGAKLVVFFLHQTQD